MQTKQETGEGAVAVASTIARIQRTLRAHVERAAEERRAKGQPDPTPTKLEVFPSLVGDEWRRAGFPSRLRGRVSGNPPRETGNPTDFAERFPLWPDDLRADLLEAGSRTDRPIVLNGGAGAGRSTVACWLALRDAVWTAWDLTDEPPRRTVRDYFQVYARAWDLLERMKSRLKQEEGESIASRVRRANFLVLDDMEEAETAWERKTLASIVQHRIDNGLRTVLVVSQKAEEFEKVWGTAFFGALRRSALIVNMHPRTTPTRASRTSTW